MNKDLGLLMISIMIVFFMSCSTDGYDLNNINNSSTNGTKVTLRINKDLFKTIDANRKNNIQTGNAFKINHAKKKGDILKINLSYSGGCSYHGFEVIWNGIVYTEDPCLVNLIISHDANGDLCEAYVTETIDVNLKELIGDSVYKDKCGYNLFTSFNSGENSDVFVEGTK